MTHHEETVAIKWYCDEAEVSECASNKTIYDEAVLSECAYNETVYCEAVVKMNVHPMTKLW